MIYEYDGRKDKCPLPLVKMRVMLKKMLASDECIVIIADSGSINDIPKYLDNKGYTYSQQPFDGAIRIHIKSGTIK